jgi:predicted metal-binding membrane protein
MDGMVMPQQAWYGAAAGYLGMWMAMMVPMMLPSLVPMLSRYRRSVRGAEGIHLHGLTALAGAGYFLVWAVVGMAAYAAGAAAMALETRWGGVTAGVTLLAAGAVQFTPWKARQLGRCRDGPHRHGAWRYGLGLGVRCALSCGNLMLVLFAIGTMDLVAMAAVTLAISAERLAPAPLRAARLAGAAILVAGALTIARV